MLKDIYTTKWIIAESLGIIDRYEKGILTLRALHYQLVSIGMTNDTNHYKRVVSAMISARWDGLVMFDTFSDLDRAMVGVTDYQETILDDEINQAEDQIQLWMKNYKKNRWENQAYYIEVFIEKKALQGVFAGICNNWNVTLGACKGYPSLTFLYEAFLRIQRAIDAGKTPIIIYFGDYDPSGEDIPRSIKENLYWLGVSIKIDRIALMQNQVIDWGLPPAPAKASDTRTAKWGGIGQVELDAVKPENLQSLLTGALENYFDPDSYVELIDLETRERIEYQSRLKQFVNDLKD